jgi:signal transduction histidine kinase
LRERIRMSVRDSALAPKRAAGALALVASSPWLSGPAGAVVALTGVLLWRRWRRPGAARGRRAAGRLLLAGGLLLGVAVAIEAGARRTDLGAGPEIQAAHARFWSELEAEADAAARALGTPEGGESWTRRAFRGLAETASANGVAGRSYLLFGPDGDLEAWWGSGFSQEIRPARRAREGARIARAELSASLYVTRRLTGSVGEGWWLIVGESFPFAGPPPLPGTERARWRVASWNLVSVGDEVRLETFGATAIRARAAVEPLRRMGFGALAVGFAVLAAARGTGLVLRLRRARIEGAWKVSRALAGGVFSALTLGAVAAGASLPVAAVSGGAAAFAALAFTAPAGGALARAGGAALAAAVGPVLLATAARGASSAPDLTGLVLGEATGILIRCAALAATFASLWLAVRVTSGRWQPPAGAALWVGAGALAVGVSSIDRPVSAGVAFAVAGLFGAIGIGGLPRRGAGAAVACTCLAAMLAGGAWATGDRIAQRRVAAERLAALVPPDPTDLEPFGEEIELAADRALAKLVDRLAARDEIAPDLAYAIWRSLPLARPDSLSGVTLHPPVGAPSSFAFGLPLTREGALDPRPLRWVDLAPQAWVERSLAGESRALDSDEREWRLSWVIVPRPGYARGGGGPAKEVPAALGTLRRAASALPELPPTMRAALYGSGRRLLASSWSYGTPPYAEDWEARGFARPPVDTPEGPARVAIRASGGVLAALFLLVPAPLTALELAATFAAGALLASAVLLLAGVALALPRRAARVLVGRALRSYSKRLVLVFWALLLAPLAGLSALVSHALERRIEQGQETAALQALRSAQRVLGEYVLSLDPGFGVGTALDDRLFEWLSRVVRNEVHLYWGSDVYASSNRDLFAAGLLPRRLPGEVWERIHLAHDRLARRSVLVDGREHIEIYAPLEVPGLPAHAIKLVLAMPLAQQPEVLAAEIARVRSRALLATIVVAIALATAGATLARRFARPIEQIAEGTRRIAEGASRLGYRPDEQELDSLAEAIDRMAARIAEGRERLLVEKGLVERIVENVTAAVVGLDREGRVLFANRMARDMLGAAPGEELASALAATAGERATAALAAAATRPEPVGLRLALEGEEREWTFVRLELPGSVEPSELLVVEDVTSAARAQRLEAWAAMARIIAHEIKNPLTPIRLSAEHLREAWTRDREHFSEVFERCTTNILDQVEELRRTASEFSLYSEIPLIEPARAEVGEAVAEIVDAYRAAPSAGVRVRFTPPAEPAVASFDRRLLGRAVRNLIENAVRASASGGEVEVGVAARDGNIAIRVADRGPGVPPELLPRILEPYFSTQSGGTGLGLPIARRVAQEHGGELRVSNRSAGGFEVTITIPSA